MKDFCSINLNSMKPVDSIQGEDAADTKLLRDLATEAHTFICSQGWCEQIDHQYLAYGIGGVVAVFLFLITPRSEEIDKCLWVIVGDLPPAYIVVEDNPTAHDALDAYCSEMETWIEAVDRGESIEDLIPVNAAATPESARQLEGRLVFLRQKVLPTVSV
jgi:hypothetical protein